MSVSYARPLIDASSDAITGAPCCDVVARYQTIRAETERLTKGLTAEDQGVQSMADASPTKWHQAHTTWFFENFVLRQATGYRVFDERYAFLFNSYYEVVGPRHSRQARGLLTRPGVEEIRAYREHVDAQMLTLLRTRGDEAEIAALTELGLQHEQQHQELLLTDILHAFSQSPLLPAFQAYVPAEANGQGSLRFSVFDGGVVEIGHTGNDFAFDNESPANEVLLNPFRLADRLTTNGEWLEFMAAGGYDSPTHWLSDGWARSCEESWSAPLYWRRLDGRWRVMTLSGLQPIDLDAPVSQISYYEADAFARWRGKRLPTECEWEHAVQSRNSQPESGNFRESGYLRPLPAGSRDSQLFGDVWEWTRSPYTPYPGFRAAKGAVGEYNGKFMINQVVLRGGSCVTSKDHIRASYRNFFYPHQRWQFSGLRLADDIPRGRSRAPQRVPAFLNDVWSGLSGMPKRLASKYFYDGEGSRLFEAICDLPEYYLTRSEGALLKVVARAVASDIEPDTALIEFGCGACTKTRVLLDRLGSISSYVPIDICEDSLKRSIEPLKATFPHLDIQPVAGDFAERIQLPESVAKCPRLGFFSGSTIGNFEFEDAKDFLCQAKSTLGPGGKFLVAIDIVKDTNVLVRAYDDAQGVTARFNKNLLVRINREFGGTFNPDAFSHLALWNKTMSRIEMHLLSHEDQNVWVAGREFHFARGETVHTEISHKYTLGSFAGLARDAGWNVLRSWQCPPPEFALVLLG
jgi:dimethylhistidine N-methyltransferase